MIVNPTLFLVSFEVLIENPVESLKISLAAFYEKIYTFDFEHLTR